MSGYGEAWFVALPDHEAALAVADMVRPHATQKITYASGRPWILGCWENEAKVATAGDVRCAVMGFCAVTEASLAQTAERVRGQHQWDDLARSLAGSFHLVAATDRYLRVQGSVSAVRRVFRTTVAGVTVAASRADILAHLAQSSIDDRWLTVRLMGAGTPHPLDEMSPWQGIDAVPAGSYLLVEHHGDARVVDWWQVPASRISLAEGAQNLREAVQNAVDARVDTLGSGEFISCDLSGGLDSTSIAFLAARSGIEQIPFTVVGLDPANEDRTWAERAAAGLPCREHVLMDSAVSPLPFADTPQFDHQLDQPFSSARNYAQRVHMVSRGVACGSGIHLTGHGGDEVLKSHWGYLHTVARTDPRLVAQHVRGYRALRHWPVVDVVRALVDRRSYAKWLADSADELTRPQPSPGSAPHGWWPALRLPPWVTQHAAEAARSLMREAADTVEPRDPTRGQHEAVEMARTAGREARMLAQMASGAAGLPVTAPFLDDRVIEACLAVRLSERTSPWRYKPLLVEAMRGIVPENLLKRSTKAALDTDTYTGLRRYRHELITLCEDTLLARRGIIDDEKLRTTIQGPMTPDFPRKALYETLACEMWLRTGPPAVRGIPPEGKS